MSKHYFTCPTESFFSGYNLDVWIRSSCPLKAKKGVYKKSLPQCSDNSLFYCVLRLASSSGFDLVSCPFYGSSRTKPMWDRIFSEFAIIFFDILHELFIISKK